LIWRACFSPN